MKLQTETLVVVADGTKYLILRNAGWPDLLDLRVQSHHEIDNPATRDQADDRGGIMAEHYQKGLMSGMEQVDRHEARETAFAKALATKLNQMAEQDQFKAIVICADPQSLGEMRPAYSGLLKQRLVGEIAKDLTNLTIPDIEGIVTAA